MEKYMFYACKMYLRTRFTIWSLLFDRWLACGCADNPKCDTEEGWLSGVAVVLWAV